MQQRIVHRVSLALCVLFFAAACVFAWAVAPGPRRGTAPEAAPASTAAVAPADEPARLFARRCAGCHEEAQMLAWVRAVDEARREAHLHAFLDSHRMATAAENRAIAAWLLGRAAEPAGGR